ncbi:MAG TPA: 6-phosphofructokinase, partial [Phycisphaerales bacterium]|nr:6-phosphofructokinase [Phycisphaerales bacterium]
DNAVASPAFGTSDQALLYLIDKVHTTAGSHHRVMVVEVMGRYAGWIALHAGVASGADVILIPEFPYEIDKIKECLVARSKHGRGYSIIVVAEGAKEKGGKMTVAKTVEGSPDPIRLGGVAKALCDQLSEDTGLSCREVVLGHVQRGGTPTPHDRALATMFGHEVIEMLMNGKENQLVVMTGGKLAGAPLAEIAGKIKTVTEDNPLVKAAIAVGTSFGR